MANEIIFECNSINNKNVREGELNILRKVENKLYFEFGTDEMNIKKRFYSDVETLDKDFNALMNLKNKPVSIENDEPLETDESAEKTDSKVVNYKLKTSNKKKKRD